MRKFAPSLLLLCGLAACAAAPLPEDHYYRLAIALPATAQTAPPPIASINVRRIHMTGIYGARPLLYSSAQTPTELRQYHYHYWADNPARLIQEQLAEYLRAAHLAREVTTAASSAGAAAEYQLDATVPRFEQRIDGAGAQAEVMLELTLRRASDGQRIFRKRYRAAIAARDSTPLSATQGLSQALAECFAAFSTDVRVSGLR